ncbi:MAG: hypothetical protein CMH76_00090 [Nitrospinae bacterium]|nr:hypothetical protein [Nitrospinota bacterium]
MHRQNYILRSTGTDLNYLGFVIGNFRFLAFGFLLSFFSGFGQTYVISVFNPDIRAQFGLSHGEFGMVFAIATVGSALCLIWFGRMIDRADLRSYTLAVLGGLACACLFMAAVPTTFFLLFALFALRLTGQGLMVHTSATTMARYFDEARGKAVSLVSVGSPLGQGLLAIAALAISRSVGWRWTWAAFAALVHREGRSPRPLFAPGAQRAAPKICREGRRANFSGVESGAQLVKQGGFEGSSLLPHSSGDARPLLHLDRLFLPHGPPRRIKGMEPDEFHGSLFPLCGGHQRRIAAHGVARRSGRGGDALALLFDTARGIDVGHRKFRSSGGRLNLHAGERRDGGAARHHRRGHLGGDLWRRPSGGYSGPGDFVHGVSHGACSRHDGLVDR